MVDPSSPAVFFHAWNACECPDVVSETSVYFSYSRFKFVNILPGPGIPLCCAWRGRDLGARRMGEPRVSDLARVTVALLIVRSNRRCMLGRNEAVRVFPGQLTLAVFVCDSVDACFDMSSVCVLACGDLMPYAYRARVWCGRANVHCFTCIWPLRVAAVTDVVR